MFHSILSWFSTSGANTLIAFVALVVSVYSVCYARRLNRTRISISNCCYDLQPDSPCEVMFRLVNLSPVDVKITSVSFSSETGEIKPVRYTVRQTPYEVAAAYEYEAHLDCPCDFAPYESFDAAYYFPDRPELFNVTVHCNKRIDGFRKFKTFSLHPVQLDDDGD